MLARKPKNIDTKQIQKLIEIKVRQILETLGNEVDYKQAVEEISRKFRLTKKDSKLLIKFLSEKQGITVKTKQHKKRVLLFK